MTAANVHCVFDFVCRNIQKIGQLGYRRIPLVFLFQLRKRLGNFVKRTNTIQGQANNTGVLGQGRKNGLTNPPYCVGNKLKTAGFVKALGGLDETKISLVDQIAQGESLVLILFGHRNDEAKVGFGQLFKRDLITLPDFLGQDHLFVRGNKVNFSNLLQVFLKGLAFPVGDGFGYLELTHRHRPGRGGLGVVVEWVRWKR